MRTLALSALALTAVVASAQTPGALALSWQGHVDTDLSLPGLIGSDHTILARMMMQFPNAGKAPIFATQGGFGAFSLMKADYGNTRDHRLVLTYGTRSATYLFPKTTAVINAEAAKAAGTVGIDVVDAAWRAAVGDQWFQVGIVRSGTVVKLYLNGKRLKAIAGNFDLNGNLSLSSVAGLPSGAATLRLGQFADAPRSTDAFFGQFYGLMDDVAAFDQAFDDTAMANFSAHPHISESSANLVGLYNFNYNPTPIPSTVAHTPTFVGAAVRHPVSVSASPAADMTEYLPPQHKTVFRLPFAPGVAYQAFWANEINSHVGSAAFSWDFHRIGSGWDNTQIQNATNGSRLYAPAAGRFVQAYDAGDAGLPASQKTSGNLIDGYDNLLIEHAPGEQTLFLHVKQGSINEASTANGFLFSPTNPNNGDYVSNCNWLKTYTFGVLQGDWITRIGTRGVSNYHLHLSSEFDSVAPIFNSTLISYTFPIAFTNYEASDDEGATWHSVSRGIPSQGQWVRNPAN